MDILRTGDVILSVLPGASSQATEQLMGDDSVTLVWEQPALFDLLIGDYINYNGKKYTLNSLPTVKKISTRQWEYNAVFQGTAYELAKVAYLLFDNTNTIPQGEFPLTGEPLDFVQLLVQNLNRVSGSEQWFVGDVATGTARTLTFSNETCADVLARLATEFETEYKVSGNTIHLTKVTRASAFIFKYGTTLYDIERVNVDSSQVITRLYAFGSTRNLASGYRGGSPRLLLPSPATYIEQNTELYGVIEGFKTFEEVYPRLASGPAGTVTAIGANIRTFTDANLDFNVNSRLIDGTAAKVRFLTGECAGYDLEIASYNSTTKTFVIIPNTDDKNFSIPNDALYPAIGDEYVLLDIEMPAAYVTNAEDELETLATEYLNKNSVPVVNYRGKMSDIYVKVNNPDIQCGDTVTIQDADFGIDTEIRIVKLQRGISDNWNIQYDLANTVAPTVLQRITAAVETNQRGVIIANREFREKYNRAYRNLEELRASVFDTDGYFDPTNIKPLSIETGMLSVGAKSQQLQTDVVFSPNADGEPSIFAWSAGSLTHFSIAETIKVWNIAAGFVDGLVDDDYPGYIYAVCSKTTNTAVILLSSAAYKFDQFPNDYYFLLGVLHSPINGVCGISLTYGQTVINGQYIRTGVISSVDGASYFDLTTGNILAGENQLNGNGSGSLAGGNVSWDTSGNLFLKGIIEALSGGKIGDFSIAGENLISKELRFSAESIPDITYFYAPYGPSIPYNASQNTNTSYSYTQPFQVLDYTKPLVTIYTSSNGTSKHWRCWITNSKDITVFEKTGTGQAFSLNIAGDIGYLAPETYQIHLECFATGGTVFATNIDGSGASDEILTLINLTKATIAKNGFCIYKDGGNHIYWSESLLEVIVANSYGIKITSAGVYKLVGANWTLVNW